MAGLLGSLGSMGGGLGSMLGGGGSELGGLMDSGAIDGITGAMTGGEGAGGGGGGLLGGGGGGGMNADALGAQLGAMGGGGGGGGGAPDYTMQGLQQSQPQSRYQDMSRPDLNQLLARRNSMRRRR